jgi:hypothetical protein
VASFSTSRTVIARPNLVWPWIRGYGRDLVPIKVTLSDWVVVLPVALTVVRRAIAWRGVPRLSRARPAWVSVAVMVAA